MATSRHWLRNILLIGAGTLLAILAIAALLLRGLTHGSQTQEGVRNSKNLYRVKVGMTQRQALTIMGPPLSKRVDYPEPGSVYYVYTTSPLASDVLSFVVGPDSLVAGTGRGD